MYKVIQKGHVWAFDMNYSGLFILGRVCIHAQVLVATVNGLDSISLHMRPLKRIPVHSPLTQVISTREPFAR